MLVTWTPWGPGDMGASSVSSPHQLPIQPMPLGHGHTRVLSKNRTVSRSLPFLPLCVPGSQLTLRPHPKVTASCSQLPRTPPLLLCPGVRAPPWPVHLSRRRCVLWVERREPALPPHSFGSPAVPSPGTLAVGLTYLCVTRSLPKAWCRICGQDRRWAGAGSLGWAGGRAELGPGF